MCDRCPCLTYSRTNGHWVSNQGRYLTLLEMMLLPAVPFSYSVPSGLSRRKFAALLGNSICVAVLEALFAKLLPAAGLWKCVLGVGMLGVGGPAPQIGHEKVGLRWEGQWEGRPQGTSGFDSGFLHAAWQGDPP